jgi:hypothetical protein
MNACGKVVTHLVGTRNATIDNFNRDVWTQEATNERECALKDHAILALERLVVSFLRNDHHDHDKKKYKTIASVKITANVRANGQLRDVVSRPVSLEEIFAHAQNAEIINKFASQITTIAQVFPAIKGTPSEPITRSRRASIKFAHRLSIAEVAPAP